MHIWINFNKGGHKAGLWAVSTISHKKLRCPFVGKAPLLSFQLSSNYMLCSLALGAVHGFIDVRASLKCDFQQWMLKVYSIVAVLLPSLQHQWSPILHRAGATNFSKLPSCHQIARSGEGMLGALGVRSVCVVHWYVVDFGWSVNPFTSKIPKHFVDIAN